MGAHLGTQHSSGSKESAHHYKARRKDRRRGAEEIQTHITCHQQQNCGDHRRPETLLVIDLTVAAGEGRSQNNGGGKDQHIVIHAQRFGVVEDQIGHEDLDGDIECRQRQQSHIQRLILPHHAGPESVEDIGKILAVLVGLDAGVTDQEEAGDTNDDHHDADHIENGGPAVCLIQIKAHESAKNNQNGDQGHHGVDALDAAAIRIIGNIRQPCIEAGIVGRGSEEGHDTVHQDHQHHAQLCCRSHRRDQRAEHIADPIGTDQGKGPDGNTPEDIAAADKDLPLAQFVAEGADEQGRHRGCHRRSGHHQGNIRCRGVEHLVNEHIEIHILNGPGYLTRQAENHQSQPEFAVFLCFCHSAALTFPIICLFYHCHFSVSSNVPAPQKDKKAAPPSSGRAAAIVMKLYRQIPPYRSGPSHGFFRPACRYTASAATGRRTADPHPSAGESQYPQPDR